MSAAPVVAFKKGPSRRPQQSRKRSTPPPDEPTSDPSSSVVRPQKKSLVNPLVQGSKRRRDIDDVTSGGLDEFDYKADESLIDRADNFATRSADYDLEAGGSTQIEGKRVKLNEDGDIDDGMYHGQKGYLTTINKRPDMMDTKMKTGPIRATANIRTITLVDYQPDVCKPYKETGFCGYGDSCKFMHDRGDYLAGWQLDKLDPVEAREIEQEVEEDVPFACIICRKEFTDPIVTKCGHYFCMA
jgi:RING finger protein 113A